MSKFMIQAGWDDVPHLSAQQKADYEKNVPEYQRDARTKGIPQLGSGAIYPIGESEIKVDPFPIPAYWPRGYALDVGWNRTAALWGAHDRDTSTVYFFAEHYRGKAEPSVHADAIRRRGDWQLGCIDPAARGRSQKDGERLIESYRGLGLTLFPAINTREAGIFECWQRLSGKTIRVFSTLQNFWVEYRQYKRDEHGEVIKENDHLMDCMRYFIMTMLGLITVPPDYLRQLGHTGGVVHDYDPFADPAGRRPAD